jgi:hypothetical protein
MSQDQKTRLIKKLFIQKYYQTARVEYNVNNSSCMLYSSCMQLLYALLYDLLDPGNFLFSRFLDFLKMFRLCNVAIFLTRRACCKLFDLFQVSNPIMMWVIFIRLLTHGVIMI